jgi:hypothetical protein
MWLWLLTLGENFVATGTDPLEEQYGRCGIDGTISATELYVHVV